MVERERERAEREKVRERKSSPLGGCKLTSEGSLSRTGQTTAKRHASNVELSCPFAPLSADSPGNLARFCLPRPFTTSLEAVTGKESLHGGKEKVQGTSELFRWHTRAKCSKDTPPNYGLCLRPTCGEGVECCQRRHSVGCSVRALHRAPCPPRRQSICASKRPMGNSTKCKPANCTSPRYD